MNKPSEGTEVQKYVDNEKVTQGWYKSLKQRIVRGSGEGTKKRLGYN